MSRPLTFRDHILRSVWSHVQYEIPVHKDGLESVLILVRADEPSRVLLCECKEDHADVTIIEPGRVPTSATECNTTDDVAAQWSRA